ncbi:MAG TPA: recombinase family protein [Firmicutes bacterium]|nr:recombinase family protein [Bacillota bacterium]
MPGKTVMVIPANPMLADLRKRKHKLRVAAYCRVSTEEEEQQNSFEVQVNYYTDKITRHEGWQLAGIFADDGISGVSTKKRDQFNKMIELCRKKKIDLILTKSISRFARNTLDCIKYVRILKSWGVPVIFEKENIDTSNMNSEMILTCLSSFAQGESESISGNVTKGIRMGYRQGKFSFHYKNFLGYRKGPDGEPEIVPEEAEVIRLIAQNFLNGDSLITIKKTLERMGILTATGNKNWSTESIQRILQNEKYMGDVLLQKTYTADFIEGKVKKNNGTLPQYYIKDHHPAIIPREMFYQIQEEIARRNSKKPANTKKAKTNRGRFTSKYALSERLVCGDCGGYFRRVTWNIHGRRQIVWRCITRLECGPKVCKNSPSLEEGTLHAAILAAIRSLVQGRQEEMAAALQDTLINCISGENDEASPIVIKNRLDELDKELDRLLTMEENEITDRRIRQISDEMLRLKQMKKRAELSAQQNIGRENKAKEILSLLRAEDLDLTEYSDALVYRIIERITVLSKEEIRIRFAGGFEITQPLH